MADAGLLMGWQRPVNGREKNALELFDSSLNFWSKHKDKGNIESFEPVILTQHGGNLNGFFLIRGKREKIDEIKRSKDYLTMVSQANYLISRFTVIDAYVGEGVTQMMGEYRKWVK